MTSALSRATLCAAAAAFALGSLPLAFEAGSSPAYAQKRGGGRPASRPAPSRGGDRPAVRNNAQANINGGNRANNSGNRAAINSGNRTNTNIRGGNTINNNNVNVNRNVYVDNDHWGNDWDDHWHPVAAAAVVATTAVVVGSIVRSLPPSCTTVIVNGIGYSQCGSTWYAPQYSGTSVQYVVVSPPR